MLKALLTDPLSFRPNPENLVDRGEARAHKAAPEKTPGSTGGGGDNEEDEEDEDEDEDAPRDGIYRPPRIARVPYVDSVEKKRRREGPLPTALASLESFDPSNPHTESTSGLGTDPASVTRRQQELAHMARYEEDNMTRLKLNKSDARRRARDEADVALGGSGNTGVFGHAGDFEGHFSDILKSIDRSRSSKVGDGYESLRFKGKKAPLLERSRSRKLDDLDFADDGEDARRRKKGRFEKDIRKEGRRRSGKR